MYLEKGFFILVLLVDNGILVVLFGDVREILDGVISNFFIWIIKL